MRSTMRKLVAVVAVALPLAGSAAWAAVSGTAHSSGFTLAVSGDCSVCHIPHAAKGNRLWPAVPIAGANAGDVIGPFCAYCHKSGGGNALAAAAADNSVWALAAHKFGTVLNPDNNTSNTGTLPYSGAGAKIAGTIQCTTCHNPHDDTNRPFLRVSQDGLCHLCHPSRGASNVAWAGMGAANATGSHPVGSNITGDITTPGDTPIDATPLGFRTYGTVADYRLGPKALGGGAGIGQGMVCQSCHSVHGVETADGGVMAALTPGEDLLAVPQSGMNGHANGAQATDARNALCEACHTRGAAATTDAKGVAYAGAFRPNPGGTAYTHPVDDLASNLNWVSSMPTAWPWTTSVNANVGVGVLCESCHMPHPAASAVAQAGSAATVASGTPILRDATATICNRCHTASRLDHHPAGVAMGRYVDDAIALTDGNGTDLSCADCHGGAGAHNWAAPAQGSAGTAGGLALNAAWEPANNARGAADIPGQISATMSKECIDCHVTVGNNGRLRAPTNNAAAAGDPAVTVRSGSTEYQDSGDGTHWIGANGGAGNGVTYSIGFVNGAAFNAATTAWPVVANNSQGGHSRWGTAVGDVVCESCHELEPDRTATAAQANGTANAAGQSSLLLYWFTDGGASADANHGAVNATSQFCTGCHGTAPGGGTPHPMTGSTITKVVDSGIGANGAARATTTLLTSNGGFAANAQSYMNQVAATITASFVTLPALDAMNCDSCHQVHDAPSNSGSWILDAGRAEVTGGLGANFGDSPASANYQAFCLDCHAY